MLERRWGPLHPGDGCHQFCHVCGCQTVVLLDADDAPAGGRGSCCFSPCPGCNLPLGPRGGHHGLSRFRTACYSAADYARDSGTTSAPSLLMGMQVGALSKAVRDRVTAMEVAIMAAKPSRVQKRKPPVFLGAAAAARVVARSGVVFGRVDVARPAPQNVSAADEGRETVDSGEAESEATPRKDAAEEEGGEAEESDEMESEADSDRGFTRKPRRRAGRKSSGYRATAVSPKRPRRGRGSGSG